MRLLPRPALLLCLSLVSAAAGAQAPDTRSEGWRIMTDPARGNCIACHALPGVSGQASDFAPSLAGIGKRLDAERLLQWVSDARRIRADTLMPAFGSTRDWNLPSPARSILDDDQIRAVVAALQGFQ